MAILDRQYRQLYGQYKQAQENVFAWLRIQFGQPSDIPLDCYLDLATATVLGGIRIPDHIIGDLCSAIHLRCTVTDLHRQAGDSDYGHEYVISVLERILFTFSQPTTPSIPHQQQHLTSLLACPYEYFIHPQPFKAIRPPPGLYLPIWREPEPLSPIDIIDLAIIFAIQSFGI